MKEIYEVAFQYTQMNVMRLVKDKSLEVVNQDFQIDCKLIFAIRKSQADAVVAAFKEPRINHQIPKNNLMELLKQLCGILAPAGKRSSFNRFCVELYSSKQERLEVQPEIFMEMAFKIVSYWYLENLKQPFSHT